MREKAQIVMRSLWLRPLSSVVLACIAMAPACAEETLPQELEGVGIDEKLGSRINLDLEFIAENGYPVTLRSYFKSGKPVVLNLVYYSCPMLCNLVMNGQTAVLRDVAWTPGKEFEVVSISIEPKDTFALASAKKKFYLESYGRPVSSGWHFLTDYQGNAKRLAEQIGFHYRWDEKTQQIAHAASIMVLTPDGRMSRYLYGIKFKPRDIRLALTEASEGKLGSTIDKLLLFCFHYDSTARSYVPFARNLMRAGGVGIVLIMGFVLTHLWRRERRNAFGAQPLVSVK